METTQPRLEDITRGLAANLEAMHDDSLTEPVGSAHTVREVLDVLQQRTNYEAVDHALHTLIERSSTDPQAREVVLHAMLPGLTRLAWGRETKSGLHAANYADALCTVIDEFYDALENPLIQRKTTRVATRLLGQIRSQLTDASLQERASFPAPDPMTLHPFGSTATGDDLASETDSQLDLLEALAWARDRDLLTLDEIRFLLAVYSPDSGIDLASIGLGTLSPTTIRKRASRLTQRIARAITDNRDLLNELPV